MPIAVVTDAHRFAGGEAMDDSREKPRVFLSHSKADIEFVQKLYDDLRISQIDPWLDSAEIRHGQPWLDAIFRGGIPTCDCILVYLTPTSIESPMVKKEIDASIIQKLRDSQVAFLPYVSNEALRCSLRPDLQALQVPEWNASNYAAMLPQVVAEIWHSYAERRVISVANSERVRRLEAELEMQRLKQGQGDGIFPRGEREDFEYIWQTLDRYEPVAFQKILRQKGSSKANVLESFSAEVHTGSLVVALSSHVRFSLPPRHFALQVAELLRDSNPHTAAQQPEGIAWVFSQGPVIEEELLMFGLMVIISTTESPPFGYGPATVVLRTQHNYAFSDKMNRFKYWLAFSGRLPKAICWKQSA